MKVAIIGAGCHGATVLSDALIAQGHEPIILDQSPEVTETKKNSFDSTPVFKIEAPLLDYSVHYPPKTGQESRRERRKQERKKTL